MRNKEIWQARRSQQGASEAWGVIAVDGRGDPLRTDAAIKWIIPATYRLDGEDANLIALTHNARLLSNGEAVFTFLPIVSSRTKLPMVEAALNGETATLPIQAAYRIMRQLGDTIHAAIAEAFLYRFIIHHVYKDVETEEAAHAARGMKQDFRVFVTEQLNQGDDFFTDIGDDEVADETGRQI